MSAPNEFARANTSAQIALEGRAHAQLQSAALWYEIRAAYSEPHRAYHTLKHLLVMFEHFDRLQDRITHKKAVALAIWFHDFVYEVGANYADNEFRSADAMRALLSQHVPQCLDETVSGINQVTLADAMIRSTKGHALCDADVLHDEATAQDTRLFLDIDLSILSTSPASIDAFERAIRYEFQQYPLPAYAQGRAAAMRSFLTRPCIYLANGSPFDEAAARFNLQTIIERCEALQ